MNWIDGLKMCLNILMLLSVYVSQGKADEIDDIIPFIIFCESNGNPNAVSEDGCIGLMQISPIVLEEYNKEQIKKQKAKDDPFAIAHFTYGGDHSWNLDTYENYHLFVPDINKEIGEWYLRRLKDHYLKSDYTIERMLAAYNGGITRLRKNNYDISKMPTETRNYVKKIMRLYEKAKP